MKKRLIVGLTLIALIFSLTACSVGKEKRRTLCIGVMPDIDSVPLLVADKKGYFKDEGLNVELKSLKNAGEGKNLLKKGTIDGAVCDVMSAISAKDEGLDIKITSKTDGNYKLVVNKGLGIKEIADLKGKDITVTSDAITGYVTDKILERAGLNAYAVNKVKVPDVNAVFGMLKSGKAVAAALPEPLASEASGSGAYVIGSSNMSDIDSGVMIFRADILKDNKDGIKYVYNAYNKAVDYLNNQAAMDYMDTIINVTGFPKETKERMQPPSYSDAGPLSRKEADNMMDWLINRKLVKNNFSYKELTDNEFAK